MHHRICCRNRRDRIGGEIGGEVQRLRVVEVFRVYVFAEGELDLGGYRA